MATLTKDQIIEAVKSMSVMELNELVKALEETFGVSAAAPVMMAGAATGGASAGEASEKEEKAEFDIYIKNPGASKIEVIKKVREITSLGLKEAKDAVEDPSKPIKTAVPKEEADAIKKKLEEAGAQVELK
ncbi:MAG: 50S ribosomal protein L7/L12 [Spirochaetes bacterium]|nr:50S ribosomal protein L7/L12 [Spirochaetota bacterium]NLJ04241.1 50S ribosomal protein L7/L12 [Exilispira sp.]MBP8990848.1 50S ribosomal protein L7/L12 [Spirochaetota bacterium]HNV43756.1 50S ribosomal protein L7/L12 [Exilispira sp.]HOV45577.1 50S ribosomal protein L7/L12 [Exilispira sp.]